MGLRGQIVERREKRTKDKTYILQSHTETCHGLGAILETMYQDFPPWRFWRVSGLGGSNPPCPRFLLAVARGASPASPRTVAHMGRGLGGTFFFTSRAEGKEQREERREKREERRELSLIHI